MAEHGALATLKDLAEKEVEDAARLLGEMRRGCQQAEEQLKMLIDYQNEYRNNLNSDMSAGMTSNRWINYQQFIQTLENGMDTAISQGGTNVSGGQRQRLSIARALVKQAPIYIFDDTFSALDFKTDAKLRAALKGYTEKSTVFIVAQRVSTIMHADQILVLDEGRVVGKGTHEELLKNCETYREIAESQLSKEELA